MRLQLQLQKLEVKWSMDKIENATSAQTKKPAEEVKNTESKQKGTNAHGLCPHTCGTCPRGIVRKPLSCGNVHETSNILFLPRNEPTISTYRSPWRNSGDWQGGDGGRTATGPQWGGRDQGSDQDGVHLCGRRHGNGGGWLHQGRVRRQSWRHSQSRVRRSGLFPSVPRVWRLAGVKRRKTSWPKTQVPGNQNKRRETATNFSHLQICPLPDKRVSDHAPGRQKCPQLYEIRLKIGKLGALEKWPTHLAALLCPATSWQGQNKMVIPINGAHTKGALTVWFLCAGGGGAGDGGSGAGRAGGSHQRRGARRARRCAIHRTLALSTAQSAENSPEQNLHPAVRRRRFPLLYRNATYTSGKCVQVARCTKHVRSQIITHLQPGQLFLEPLIIWGHIQCFINSWKDSKTHPGSLWTDTVFIREPNCIPTNKPWRSHKIPRFFLLKKLSLRPRVSFES